MKTSYLVSTIAVTAAVTAQAALMDNEEKGIKLLDKRLTLNPYVALSYTYDSNVDSSKHSQSGSQWTVNPGLNMTYKGGEWDIMANVYYTYHAYNRYTSQLNSSSYGENLSLKWSNIGDADRGWTLVLKESYAQIAQDDDMSNHKGRGIGRDRQQFSFDGTFSGRLNSYWHAGLDMDYYWLDYDNNVEKYATMYGWKRLTVGGTAGCTISKWTDFLVSGGYHWYDQDNVRHGNGYSDDQETSSYGRRIRSSNSKGWTVMAGIGTYATEKLSYRFMTGWSHFEYADGVKDLDGWTYKLAADWQINAENTWHAMLVGSSYYQPSEVYYGSAMKVYTLSAGLANSIIPKKLRGTIDLAYRKETQEFTAYPDDDYDEDIITARVGLNYNINRMLSVFGRVEYQTAMYSGGSRSHEYDYDRWRGTVGLRFTY